MIDYQDEFNAYLKEIGEEEITDNKEDDNIEDEETEDESDIEQPEDESESETEDTSEQDDEETDTEDETKDSETETKSGKTIKYKGTEIFLNDEELVMMAQKGMDYTRKTQDLAKYRQYIEMIEETGLSLEDFATLNAAKSGDKSALATIMKKNGVDVFDIDTEQVYTPKIVERNYALEDVIETIKSDEVNGKKIDQYISMVPQSAKDLFIKNPNVLRGLYEDQRSGIADKLMPDVIKEMAINPDADFVETYRAVGERILLKSQKEETTSQKPDANRDTKKKATISKRNKSSIKEHQDVWTDDALYEAMKRKVDPMYR